MNLVEGLPVGRLADSGKAVAMAALRAGKEAAEAVVEALDEAKEALEDFFEAAYHPLVGATWAYWRVRRRRGRLRHAGGRRG